MTAPSNQYLTTSGTGNTPGAETGGFRGAGIEVPSIQDMLNNMHPAVAVLHAMFEQPAADSVKPQAVIDYHDIDRTTTITNLSSYAMQAGQATMVRAPKYPSRLFTRLQTFHEGVAASRESQQVKLYGVTDSLDYGIDNLLVAHMDIWERILHFSQGTEDNPESSGAAYGGTPVGPKPRTQGLVAWAAATGLERRHGTAPTVVGDGLQAVAKTYWTSFYDAAGTPLDRDLFYNSILGPAWSLGHDTDGCMILSGQKLMNVFAGFNFVPGRGVINERSIPARDAALMDIVTTITTPANGTVFLVPDRFLSVEGASMTFNNTAVGYVGGTGTINKTIYMDETLLSVIPSKFEIPTMQGLSYKELSTDGDYALGMLVAQKGLLCKNLFGVAGATNLVP